MNRWRRARTMNIMRGTWDRLVDSIVATTTSTAIPTGARIADRGRRRCVGRVNTGGSLGIDGNDVYYSYGREIAGHDFYRQLLACQLLWSRRLQHLRCHWFLRNNTRRAYQMMIGHIWLILSVILATIVVTMIVSMVIPTGKMRRLSYIKFHSNLLVTNFAGHGRRLHCVDREV